MGDGLRRVHAVIKHGQAKAPDPLSKIQRLVLRAAALRNGNYFVVPAERRTAHALERRGLVTVRIAYRQYTYSRPDGTSFVRSIKDVFVTATDAGRAVFAVLEKA